VTFWGSQWAKDNSLSGGAAPSSFKGYANSTPNPPVCGVPWKSEPGNSSGPPPTVPQYIAVLVTSSVTKSGSIISGDVRKIVVIKTDPGYGPNPGHAGTGTVVSVVCSQMAMSPRPPESLLERAELVITWILWEVLS